MGLILLALAEPRMSVYQCIRHLRNGAGTLSLVRNSARRKLFGARGAVLGTSSWLVAKCLATVRGWAGSHLDG